MIEFTKIKLKEESIFDYVEILYKTKNTWLGKRTVTSGYRVLENIGYFSKRYNKWVVCEAKDNSDGATGAKDIDSFGWIFHDDIKKFKKFEDGSKCTNPQASYILYDILKSEGYWFRARSWFITTLAWGTLVK